MGRCEKGGKEPARRSIALTGDVSNGSSSLLVVWFSTSAMLSIRSVLWKRDFCTTGPGHNGTLEFWVMFTRPVE